MKQKFLIVTIITIMTFSLKSQSFQTLTDTNVIFVDYNPDVILHYNYNQESLSIDINNDSVLDFKFYFTPGSNPGSYISDLNTNCKYTSVWDTVSNDSLNNPAISWSSGANFWYSPTDAIFGIKIISGSNNYYGWIHAVLSFVPWIMTIDKYAFCKIPNYPFHKGQTTLITNIPNIITPDSTYVYLGSGNSIVVQSGKIINSVTLTSTTGIVVASQNNINSYSTNISTAGIAHGTYIVQVQFTDLSNYTKQIVL